MLRLNGVLVDVTIFPDGTSQVWKIDEKELQFGAESHVIWDFHSESEVMHLAQLKDLLDNYNQKVHLYISYLPYGRQDKEVSNTATFALSTFSRILWAMEFTTIQILDPHSDYLEKQYPDLVSAEYPTKQLQDIIKKTNSTLVCYPDHGALVKYSEAYKSVVGSFIYGEKVRDQLTGHILKYDLHVDTKNLREHRVLIVDDICDGGATFSILTDSLRNEGVQDVNLFVTHGIFSKGVRLLKVAGISRIFTAKGEAFHDPRGNLNKVSYEPIETNDSENK